MKMSVIILALGIVVLSCKKKDTEIQTNTVMDDSTMTNDTVSMKSLTPSDSSRMKSDSMNMKK